MGEGTERSRLQAALQRERTAAEETACEQAARNAVQAQALSTARTEADLQVRVRNCGCATIDAHWTRPHVLCLKPHSSPTGICTSLRLHFMDQHVSYHIAAHASGLTGQSLASGAAA